MNDVKSHMDIVVAKLERRAWRARVTGFTFVSAIVAFASVGALSFSLLPNAMPNINITTGSAAANFDLGSLSFGQVVGQGILRVGAVLLAVFLIQIMVSFARYYFKLADHLEGCVFGLLLSPDKLPDFSSLVSTIAPAALNFGKVPSSPYEKALDIARDAVGKIQTK